MAIPPRPISKFGKTYGDDIPEFQANVLWETIQSVRLGVITPSSGAMSCFTWISDIVSGRCPPFYIQTEPKPEYWQPAEYSPGDNPGMEEFHKYFCGFLMQSAGLCDTHDQQDLLLSFVLEYWRLLKTKKWIYRGETMELPTLGLDTVFCRRCWHYHWPHERTLAQTTPEPTYVPRETRFLALISKHKRFAWMHEELSNRLNLCLCWDPETGVTPLGDLETAAEIVEIVGGELYNLQESREDAPHSYEFLDWNSRIGPTWRIWGGNGECRKRWAGWIERLQALVAADRPSRELKGMAGRALAALTRVVEEQSAIDADAI